MWNKNENMLKLRNIPLTKQQFKNNIVYKISPWIISQHTLMFMPCIYIISL